MKIIFPVLAILIITCLYMCTSSKEVNSKDDLQLYFGSGGGFTGYVTQYRLFKNGAIEVHKTNEPEWKTIFKIDKSIAKQYLIQANQLDLFTEVFSKPANRYYFIKVADETGENTITWGAQGSTPKKEILVLYKILNNHVVEYNMQNSKK